MPVLLVLPSSLYCLGAVHIPLPRGSSERGSPLTPSLSLILLLALAAVPSLSAGLRKGWQSSAPAQGIWQDPGLPLGGCCTCTEPQLQGCGFAGFLGHGPLCVSAGRSTSTGERCWAITMETASLLRAACVCTAIVASGTRECFIRQRCSPRGHFNTAGAILGVISAWGVAFLKRV